MNTALKIFCPLAVIAIFMYFGTSISFGNQPKAHVVQQWSDTSLLEIYAQLNLNPVNLNKFPPEMRTRRFAHGFLANDPENFMTDEYRIIHKGDPVDKGTMLDKVGTRYVLVLTDEPLDQDFLVITPPSARTAQL